MIRNLSYLFIILGFVNCEEAVEKKTNSPKLAIPERIIPFDHPDIEKEQNGDIYFADSLFNGYLISYHENDTIAMKVGYLNGKKNGLSIAFYPSSNLMYERPYLNGEKHGDHIGYYETGQKKFHYIFENGFSEGNHKKWYPDGSLMSNMNYAAGKELGQQQMWRPDGKLRSNYIVRENGRRYGLQGIKRCTKIDGKTKEVDPYLGS